MEAYFLAKKKLFDGLLPGGIAVANADSSYGERIVRECRAGEIITFGRNNSSARLRYEPIRQDIYGSSLKFHWENGEFEVETQLVGDFQGENIALAVAVALGLGIRPETIAAGIKSCRSVPGRMEAVNLGQPFGVYADYAHAPDALQKVLETARKFCSGRLFVVFGCGGDRDRGKRPIMGRIATELSDRVIITSDNSRSEKPDDIIKMILSGIAPGTGAKVTAEPNRRKAIFYALGLMKENDVLLICGKGHENYQEIDGIRHDFDDRLVAAEALKELGWDFTFK